MKFVNRIKTSLAAGRCAFGTWAQMGSPEFCEIAARSGMDFVIVDMEHGSFGIETATNMIRAAECGGASAMVRVPDAAPSTILKALDAGATSVLVPNVNSREMAEAIVAATRFGPIGNRSACPCTRATGHGVMRWSDFLEWARESVLVALLIETPMGFDHFDEIISVPGVDIVAFGPFDLSQALGLDGNWKHPSVVERQAALIQKALARGIQVMPSIFDNEPEVLAAQVSHWKGLGAKVFGLSGDRFMLSAGFGAMVTRLAPHEPTPPGQRD